MPPVDLPLRDIHLPEAIGWWPPAIGWWLLAALLLLLTGFSFWLYRRLTRRTALKTAGKALSAIRRDNTMDDLTKLSEISILLRRVAISTAPRSRAAGLTGEAWLAYLDGPMQGMPFSQGIGRHLSDAHYRKEAPCDLDIPRLINLCEDWLKAQAKK
jgi:hypothetical protein